MVARFLLAAGSPDDLNRGLENMSLKVFSVTALTKCSRVLACIVDTVSERDRELLDESIAY